MLNKMLLQRNVGELCSANRENWSYVKSVLVRKLCNEEYGIPVPAPDTLSFSVVAEDRNERFCAGLGECYRGTASGTLLSRPFSFPFTLCIPRCATPEHPVPFFVLSNFHKGEPNEYFPTEEIIDRGFAVLYVYYKDVTSDDGDFKNGIAGCLFPDGERYEETATGKLQMWAWANMRLLDYALTNPRLDAKNAAVIGHSRLGKTALVTGMLDERFRYVISNDSGCSGAALTSGKVGERIRDITRNFPYWFCPAYQHLVGADEKGCMPFDQHMLLSTVAPRVLMVGSAEKDLWADPDSEKLACHAAGKVWDQMGLTGLVAPNALPKVGDVNNEGNVCYHLRAGVHFLSRIDWSIYMDTIEKKMKEST